VRHIHLTGSGATCDAIVFGSAERKRLNQAVIDIPVTAELGGVSPVIVVPDRWAAADLRHQAEHVATMRLHNNGYNCIAGQVLILSADWPQRGAFLDEVRRALARAPRRPDYYPGSAARVRAAAESHPTAGDLDGRLLVTGCGPATRPCPPSISRRFWRRSTCRVPASTSCTGPSISPTPSSSVGSAFAVSCSGCLIWLNAASLSPLLIALDANSPGAADSTDSTHAASDGAPLSL
jgi:hypothetical protein